MNDVGFEVLKLGTQFVGAVLVARLTVSWALGRHKTEKTWERKEAAFSEILNALLSMERALTIVQEGPQSYIDFEKAKLREAAENELSAARTSYQQAISTAYLLLPDKVAKAMIKTESKISALLQQNTASTANLRRRDAFMLIQKHRQEIVEIGRQVLGDPNSVAPDLFSEPLKWLHYRNEIRKSYDDQP
ncbi:hypothetical protein EPK99_24945 [Neorhizobium lilium]|uniref:Uncharacterized protein n=1 Tax=Neorhizobium lilium TaxID=2503024 RepID=A0A444LA41_9HYPH|nr:hypothetical protein [Neorhizobium lilium]RWX74434.1 hypothetical protein EPK99_24945 [Neorhizobium lilium]